GPAVLSGASKMSQMELFTTKKEQKKPRELWQVPPAERRITRVSKMVYELLREQEDCANRGLTARHQMMGFIEGLKGREDIWPLISHVYWKWARFVGEDELAKWIGVTLEMLQAKIEPEIVDVRCHECNEYL